MKKISLTGILSLKYKGKGLQVKGFTLVELIVVITILAILGTIAFISLQGYSRDARNSVRISDMSRIKTSLELFQLDAGKYPEANDDFFAVTYSGAVARTQGFFGDTTFSNVEKLDKIPKDPSTDKKYIYSTTNTRQEFEIAGVMEGDQISFIGEQTNAGDKTAILKITGTYNGKILKVSTGGLDYILAIPSIINGRGFDIDDIIKNNYLAYDGYKNLPAQYDGGTYNVLGDPDITLVDPNNYVVFSGDIKNLSDSTSIGTNARNDLLTNLQKAYSGSTIANIGEIAEILNTTGTTEIELLASTIINNNLGGSFIASSGGGSGLGGGAVPINMAGGLSFTDTDDNTGQIGGTLTITASGDESDIDSYVIYWGSNTTTKLNGTPITTITSDGTDKIYDFSENTLIPLLATHLLVFTNNTGGEMLTGINVAIEDNTIGGGVITIPIAICTSTGQIYYADNTGNKLATVTNAGIATWESGKSISDLTCSGNIIMCNGNNSGYTLQACNVGTNTVGTSTTSYGGLFQMGNHFDFRNNQFTNGQIYPTTGTTQVSSIPDYGTFSTGTFLKVMQDWTSLDSDGALRSASWNPCGTGYHVPTKQEWEAVVTVGGWGINTVNGTKMKTVLKLPYAGIRDWDDAILDLQGTNGYYWTSSPRDTQGYAMSFYSTSINENFSSNRARGLSVRCFKN